MRGRDDDRGAGTVEPTRELERVEQVRELGCCVRAPRSVRVSEAAERRRVDTTGAGHLRGDHDDPRRGRRREQRQRSRHESRVTEMVHAHLELEAVDRGPGRRPHEAGVRDDDVDAHMLRLERGDGATDGGEVGEVEREVLEVGGRDRTEDPSGRDRGALRVARREDHAGAVACERAGVLEAESAARPGDECDLPRQIGDVLLRERHRSPCPHRWFIRVGRSPGSERLPRRTPEGGAEAPPSEV